MGYGSGFQTRTSRDTCDFREKGLIAIELTIFYLGIYLVWNTVRSELLVSFH